ncbi:MAG TPA: sigma-E processing peptidase SpoIIGA [Bacillota bacterium]|jgi:stage II sporulation protein GA (sporulation sigma-E factor processing peptidase)
MRVYADIFLIENFLIDLALLWAAAGLARRPARPWRLALGAALGAGYALFALAGPWPMARGLMARLLVAAAMLAAAFCPVGWGVFAGLLAYLLLTAVFLGGTVLALSLLTSSIGLRVALGPADTGWWTIAAGLAIAFIGGRAAWAHFRRRAGEEGRLLQLEVEIDRRRADFTALVDTGNQLQDPFSGHPVVVVELGAVSEIIPAGLADIYGTGPAAGLEGQALDTLTGLDRLPPPWPARVRLVPFTSLGRENGLLLGFRPDSVTVRDDRRRARYRDVVVCVYAGALSAAGTYNALLHPDLAAGHGGADQISEGD